MRTGANTAQLPQTLLVELPNHGQQLIGGRVNKATKLGDLLSQLVRALVFRVQGGRHWGGNLGDNLGGRAGA